MVDHITMQRISKDFHLARALRLSFGLLVVVGCRSVRYFDDMIATGHGNDSESDGDVTSGFDSDITSDNSSDSAIETDTGDSPSCSNDLTSRLTVTDIEVGADIRYAERGYENIVVPSRISVKLRSDETGYVAWADKTLESVHVTPIDAKRMRSDDDFVVQGNGFGGLVALDDGFALLTRRPDSGDDPAYDNADRPANAVVFVQYDESGAESSTVLTGSLGVNGEMDYNNVENFRSQLAWDGTRFAAYFEVRAGVGHSESGTFRDKMVFLDPSGAASLGWSFACGTVRDMEVLWTGEEAAALCMSDGTPNGGLNLLFEDRTNLLVSAEVTTIGYSGGALGGAVRLADGTFAVVWSSRRWNGVNGVAAEDTHDIAMVRMTSDLVPIGEVEWITKTPKIDEVNLHITPYGPGRILLIWNAVENCTIGTETCFGDFSGTYFQTITPDGLILTDPEKIAAPMTWAEAPVVYPNGDMVWAFVDPNPDYTVDFPNPSAMEAMEAMRTLHIAYLKYCDFIPVVL
jgi:hypothetical protein